MKNLNEIEQQYVNAALIHSAASANGDYRTVNKKAKELKIIFKEIENNAVDKKILLVLLNHERIAVRTWAGAHLLGLKYEIGKAEEVLQEISRLKGNNIEENLRIFSAKTTLDVWKKQGYLKF